MLSEAHIEILKAAGKGAVSNAVRMGRVRRVVGLIVEGYGVDAPVGGLCIIRRDLDGTQLFAEIIAVRDDTIVLMPIGDLRGIQVGDSIELVSVTSEIGVCESMQGRVLDGMGEPIDGGSPIHASTQYPIYREVINPVQRRIIKDPIGLGIRAIDGFMTCAYGQRISILAGSGVGKSTLLGMIARHAQADVNVIGLIGERGRELREFIEHDLGEEGLRKSIVVVATSDAPALVRKRAAYVATTIAEYFRDQGKRVLLLMDSLTRYAMASREIGLSLGEPPTVKGYTPSFYSELPKLLERAGTGKGDGDITGLYTILTEGDDIQDPVADAVRAIVDGHIVLSRKLTNKGYYPPIDVLESMSRLMKGVVSDEHHQAMITIRQAMSLYDEMEDYVNMGVYAHGKNPKLDKVITRIDMIRGLLQQDVQEVTPIQETVARMMKIAHELAA